MNLFMVLALCPLIAQLTRQASAEPIDGKQDLPLAVSVSAVVPFNPDDSVVVVKYCNQGKIAFRLSLPGKKQEIQLFSSVSLQIDEKKADTVVDPRILRIADVKLTRRVDLAPGESAELEVHLAWIFKIPKDWKRLEIRATHGSGWAKINGILILER